MFRYVDVSGRFESRRDAETVRTMDEKSVEIEFLNIMETLADRWEEYEDDVEDEKRKRACRFAKSLIEEAGWDE